LDEQVVAQLLQEARAFDEDKKAEEEKLNTLDAIPILLQNRPPNIDSVQVSRDVEKNSIDGQVILFSSSFVVE
jgi:hypothetical protein